MGNISSDDEGVTVEMKLSELFMRPFKIPFQNGVCRSYVGNAIHYAAYEILKEKAPHLIKDWEATDIEGDCNIVIRYTYKE